MKKAVVTGANGFVGSALVRKLVSCGVAVLALDLPGNNNQLAALGDAVKFEGFNLDSAADLLQKLDERDYDVFYHLAWAGSAGTGRTDTRLQLDNAQWTVDCLRLSKSLGCQTYVGAGSIMEDETWQAVTTQESQPGMAYIYGAGKQVSHCISKAVAAQIGVSHIWGMITNAYGVGELSPRFINTTLRKIIHGEPLQFTSATQNYDFIYVDDVAAAFYLLGERGKPFSQYIIGSGNAQPLKNFIQQLQKTVAPDCELIFGDVPFTGVNLPLSSFDTSSILKDTGFSPEISFCDGVQKTMDWIKKQENK